LSRAYCAGCSTRSGALPTGAEAFGAAVTTCAFSVAAAGTWPASALSGAASANNATHAPAATGAPRPTILGTPRPSSPDGALPPRQADESDLLDSGMYQTSRIK